ncbi:MAG: hypothetical protein PHO56_01670 [Patescibacteria group bacterium]|nr:hypothetical protein [Patescibacteria group bacterium]
MRQESTFEPGVMRQLEIQGKRISLNTSWQEIPVGMVAVFCRKTWENCQGVSLSVAYTEEAFESLKENNSEAVYLLPRKIPLFFQKKEEEPVIVSEPIRRKKRVPAFRNLCAII